ncbi:MAG: hypothetical protein LBP63_10540 [Prevotellaceae bacterium]|jgi:hypothetical protein|nr:hypothetical protein [Prevotellaceae bacterium]
MQLLFSLVALFAIFGLQAQTVNDIPLSELDAEYVMIVGTGKFLSNKVTVKLDFGQKTKYWGGGKEQKLLDENGKKLELNSMIDALNFMQRFGYEFVNAYVITSDKGDVFHWILRKKRE